MESVFEYFMKGIIVILILLLPAVWPYSLYVVAEDGEYSWKDYVKSYFAGVMFVLVLLGLAYGTGRLVMWLGF